VRDRTDPNHARLEANRAVLQDAGLDVVELELLPYRQWAGRRLPIPYLNFYVGNGCVIVPLACLPEDEDGLARIREVFPDREVVGVPATNLARRGGGAHCITLQQPAVG
jgi:agmatine deiminase